MKQVTFTVTGRGHFPVDMLRYDGCFPATTESAIAITEPKMGERAIEMRLNVPQGKRAEAYPTVSRWNSFGWGVTNIQRRTI